VSWVFDFISQFSFIFKFVEELNSFSVVSCNYVNINLLFTILLTTHKHLFDTPIKIHVSNYYCFTFIRIVRILSLFLRQFSSYRLQVFPLCFFLSRVLFFSKIRNLFGLLMLLWLNKIKPPRDFRISLLNECLSYIRNSLLRMLLLLLCKAFN